MVKPRGKAEVATEDAVKGDEPSNGLIENSVMLLRGTVRTLTCHIESSPHEELREAPPLLPWFVEHAGSILSRCQKGRDGRTPFEILYGEKPSQQFVPYSGKVSARQISTEPMNRVNPRYKFGIWLGI